MHINSYACALLSALVLSVRLYFAAADQQAAWAAMNGKAAGAVKPYRVSYLEFLKRN